MAKAGKSVLLLEANGELGSATTSVRVFPDFDARLSRYSYLVSLLPDKIIYDLNLNFKTLHRAVMSYTPIEEDASHNGLLISRNWDEKTISSFWNLSDGAGDMEEWQSFMKK